MRVKTRAEAIKKVRDGEVLGALVIPEDTTRKLQAGLEPAQVEVFYNADDPVKARFVRDTIKSQVQDANTALTKELSKVALDFLNLIGRGGQYNFLGREFDVLGLERSERILARARADLPRGSPARAQIDQVIRFARLARENLDLSDDVLSSVSSPLHVKQTQLDGGATPLSSFAVAIAAAVSLMFVTLLLAAGALALEREENAYLRLVRGLVSRTALLFEKAGPGRGLLHGRGRADARRAWGCSWTWTGAASAAGRGRDRRRRAGLRRHGPGRRRGDKEVRAASLLCVMASLPLTFLALVPSGSVAPALFDVIRVISAVFPFKPTLNALDVGPERRRRPRAAPAAPAGPVRGLRRADAAGAEPLRLERETPRNCRWPSPPPACGGCAAPACCAAWSARPS